MVADMNVEGGEATVDLIKESGGEAIFIRTDVTKGIEVEAMVDKIIATYGQLDCALNNAGVAPREFVPTAEFPEDDWDRIIAINLKGVYLCLKYELRQMLKQGGGTIVNMASIVGMVGWENASAYVASKHGVIGQTKNAALEYAKENIRVNAVCPGYIDTPMTVDEFAAPEEKEQSKAGMGSEMPVGRIGNPNEVAEAVVWLCSDAASFVTGHTMAVDGGYLAR